MKIEQQILNGIVVGISTLLLASCGTDSIPTTNLPNTVDTPPTKKDSIKLNTNFGTDSNLIENVDSMTFDSNNCPACGMG